MEWHDKNTVSKLRRKSFNKNQSYQHEKPDFIHHTISTHTHIECHINFAEPDVTLTKSNDAF